MLRALLLLTLLHAPQNGREPGKSEVRDADKPEVAARSVTKMKETLKKMLAAAKNAKNDRDAVKSNCVNEKLVQIKGLLQVGQGFETQLSEALARQDKEESDRAFEKLSIASRKAGELAAEATTCVGELAVYSGDTVVQIENSGSEEGDDPTAPRFIIQPVPRPPQVSPYQ
jgi:hypothetical protein